MYGSSQTACDVCLPCHELLNHVDLCQKPSHRIRRPLNGYFRVSSFSWKASNLPTQKYNRGKYRAPVGTRTVLLQSRWLSIPALSDISRSLNPSQIAYLCKAKSESSQVIGPDGTLTSAPEASVTSCRITSEQNYKTYSTP